MKSILAFVVLMSLISGCGYLTKSQKEQLADIGLEFTMAVACKQPKEVRDEVVKELIEHEVFSSDPCENREKLESIREIHPKELNKGK